MAQIQRFFVHPVQNERLSRDAGHPVFEDKVYLEIITPGEIDAQFQRKATDNDKVKYAEAWARFKAGEAETVDGWRIDQWAAVTPAQVETLKAMKFYTVELLADASDSQLSGIMGGTTLREKARAALKQAADSAVAEKYAAENAQLKQDIEQLREQLSGFIAEQKRGPGRPRKAEVEA